MRPVGAVGAGMLVLLVVGCGGAQPGGEAPPKASAASAAARPVPMRTAPRPATWTGPGGEAHPLRIAPEGLARGSVSDLENVRLDDDLDGTVPYYLTFSYTNTGKETLRRPDPQDNFSVNGTDGRPGERLVLMANPSATGSGLPKQCDRSGPDELAAGRTAKVCQVFMLPEKQQPVTVSYTDEEGGPLIWEVDGGEDDAGSGVLSAGETAESAWTDSDDRPVPLLVTPRGVRAGAAADLSRYDLDEEEKKLVPYYVTVEYRNRGRQELYPGMQDGVVLWGASGRQARRMTLLDLGSGGNGLEQCPDTVPEGMVKSLGTVAQCSVHMLPVGDRPAAVVFESRAPGTRSVTWRATDG